MLGAECCCAKYRGRRLKKTRLRQAACRFAQAGAITIICARGKDKLTAAVDQIKAYADKHAKVHSYAVDIADATSCADFVQTLQAQYGGVDFLINNAGRS